MSIAQHYPCAKPLWGDVIALACTLTDYAPQVRAEMAADLIGKAIDNTSKGMQPTNILGVCWGHPAEPALTDPNYLDCLKVAIDAIKDLRDLADARQRAAAA